MNKFNIANPKTNLQLLLLLVFIYSLSLVIFRWIPGLGITVLISFVFYLLLLFGKKSLPFGGLNGALYILLLVWSIIVTLGTFSKNMWYTNDVLEGHMLAVFASPLFLPNFLPFILLLINKKNFELRYLVGICAVLSVIYIAFYPIAFFNMIHFSWDNSINLFEEGSYMDFVDNSTLGIRDIEVPVMMMFLYCYLDNKLWKRFLLTTLGAFIILLYLARRGAVVMMILQIVGCWGMYSFMDKKTSKAKMIIIALVVCGLAYFLVSKNADGFLGTLLERADEDSRSGVEANFWLDILKDDSIFFGRGWFGEYYDAIFGKMRPHIETGYMSLILRGGVCI